MSTLYHETPEGKVEISINGGLTWEEAKEYLGVWPKPIQLRKYDAPMRFRYNSVSVYEEEWEAFEALFKAAQELELRGLHLAIYGRSDFNAAIDVITKGREGREEIIDK